MSTVVVIMILSVGSILSNGFEQYYMFWNGMVNGTLTTLDVYVVQQGIVYASFSYAAAVGISKVVVSIILLVFVNKVSKITTGSSLM
jgi:ABC-type polysaccharide transport system permease subunit